MKIERLSENQIRCTLNKADLNEKQLKLSELAYGTQKARELFKDMLQQASVEVGFETNDTPLMIEAIPISPDCLVLIVTKVEDPEELDTRFSRFSRTSEYDIDDDDYDDEYTTSDDIDDDSYSEASDDNDGVAAKLEISGKGIVPQSFKDAMEELLNAIPGLAGASIDISAASDSTGRKKEGSAPENNTTSDDDYPGQDDLASLFTFDSLSTVISASKQIASFYFSNNSLYKNPSDNMYYLLLTNSHNTRREFSRVCHILAEYGCLRKLTFAMPAYFKEHFIYIVKDEAIQTLSAL